MKIRVLLALCISAICTPAGAAIQGFALTGGAFNYNMFTLTQDKTGKSSTLGDLYFPLGAQYSFQVMEGWTLIPSLHFTHLTTAVVPKETPEGGATKNMIFLSLPMVTNLTTWLDGKIGLGYFRYEIKGDGGTVQLNNGTGTSTFYHPSRTQTSSTFYMILGGAVPFTGWQLDVDLFVSGPASEDRRNYSLYIYATYPWGASY